MSDGPDLFSGRGDWAVVIDFAGLPLEVVFRIYGDRGNYFGVSTLTLVAGMVAWTATALAVIAWSYHRLEVTR